MSTPADTPAHNYPSGHSSAVLSSHKSRTADNSAAYALDALKDAFTRAASAAASASASSGPPLMLDIGCGPGTITVGFAEKFGASLGVKVVGMDYSAEPLDGARKLAAERGLMEHCSFEQGDVYKLRWPDATFTAAHAHQVFIHLPDPVAALKEIKRVLKPSGSVLALREGDIGATAIHPLSHGLAQWKELWSRVGRAAGGEPDAGRRLKEWALGAGFSEESMEFTAGTFCYSTPAERAWWGELWAVRTADVTHSSWAAQAIKDGHATQSELNAIALCWRVWAKIPGATFIMPHGQLLIRI